MMMREALRKLATLIRVTPELYNFQVYGVPDDGEAGDIIGWVARIRGVDTREIPVMCSEHGKNYHDDFCLAAVECEEKALYDRLDKVEERFFGPPEDEYLWREDASRCSAVLVHYANTFYPEGSEE